MRYTVQRPRKLSVEKVLQIRALRLCNKKVYSCQKLAGLFGVDSNMVWKVLKGIDWKLTPFPIQPEASRIAEEFLKLRLLSKE